MRTDKIKLKPISELLDKNFFIPSYQRGYRWGKFQVEDLLNDINEFDEKKDGNFYCLQPLVVKEDIINKRWIVIDGQQRLTTIYLILKMFGENDLFSINYETRPETNLKDAKIDMKVQNIDEDFIKNALETIDKLKNKISHDIVDKIKNQTQIIWYKIGENEEHYEVFKRLNSGKISLSNAELIKALLLNYANFQGFSDEKIYLKQLEMAGEWDRIEQNLHDNALWFFINPNPESPKYHATRIDFVFELMLLCRKNDKGEFLYSSLDENIEKNEYFIFLIFSEDIKLKKEIWEELINTFRTIKSWFDNREYYHFVGYLMNQKGENKINILQNLIVEFQKNTKPMFLMNIRNKCIESIIKKNEIDLSLLEYGKHNEQLHNLLLLFNIATVQSQISEISRYPFDKHFEATKKKWSLEHIHAQNERLILQRKSFVH